MGKGKEWQHKNSFAFEGGKQRTALFRDSVRYRRYLPKETETDNLIQAIRQVYQGKKYFDETIIRLLFDDFYTTQRNEQQKKKLTFREQLTRREMEVLSLIVAGKSYSEIGEELSISTKTVDTHKTHILDKLGLKNTVELVKYALKNELISI